MFLFANRTDAEQSVQDAAAATDAVRAGEGLVVFPEGTFHRAPGLRPFKLGGFLVAAQVGVPLLPVTIRGMRSILRDGQKVPRPGRASISIGAPLIPEGTDWGLERGGEDTQPRARGDPARLRGAGPVGIVGKDTRGLPLSHQKADAGRVLAKPLITGPRAVRSPDS